MLHLTLAASLALLASCASLVHALPAPVVSDSTIHGDVPTISNADGTVNPHLLRRNLHQTFAKYSFGPLTAAATTNSSTRAEPAAGLYTAGMSFGSPPQGRNLILDTGSTDLFIQEKCAQGAGCAPNYLPRSSATYRTTGRTTTLNYVSDSVTGRVVTDRVTFGGRTVENQAFLVVPDSNTPGASGNIGLGLNAHANPTIGTPLLENLRATGQLGNGNSFALQLDRTGNSAAVTLGLKTGPGAFTLPYSTYNVMYPELLGRWALEMKTVSSLDNKSQWRDSVAVFIDSGAASSFVPRAAARVAHSQVEHQVETVQIPLQGQVYDVDFYFYPCNATIDYYIQFTDSRTFRADPRDQSVGSDGNGMCQSMLNGVDIEYNGLKAGILGAPWLKSKQAIFAVGSDSSNTGATISFWDGM
ncbi:hypothetical protein JCM10908_005145 [Rhodotorula pacifica]|uniref:pepsin-like aspartic protease n=1 Tax=Rhodotorula pacifica TaxID=1495444 RepID=UPI0031724FCA